MRGSHTAALNLVGDFHRPSSDWLLQWSEGVSGDCGMRGCYGRCRSGSSLKHASIITAADHMPRDSGIGHSRVADQIGQPRIHTLSLYYSTNIYTDTEMTAKSRHYPQARYDRQERMYYLRPRCCQRPACCHRAALRSGRPRVHQSSSTHHLLACCVTPTRSTEVACSLFVTTHSPACHRARGRKADSQPSPTSHLSARVATLR